MYFVSVLVWLRNVKAIKLNAIRADIPYGNLPLSKRVFDLQKSDKTALVINMEKTSVEEVNGHQFV